MKKLLIAACATASFCAFAQEEAAPAPVEEAPAPVAVEEAPAPAQTEEATDTVFWGFGNYGIYSGYQLYGSLVNSEPTLQGYAEVNANIKCDDCDFGYLGVGVWSNTDLTDKRHETYGKWFNEWDFNLHWGKTFWFDDDKTWGLDYRTSLVWYYYPHHRNSTFLSPGHTYKTATTMDWNHSFALVNPYLTPFLDWVHEYHENKADLLQFGVRRAFAISDEFTLTPAVVFVYRDHRYNWCFPTAGFSEFHNGGLATAKLQIDANYQITPNFGLFAKVAFCTTLDKDLRDAADNGSGADYGKYKDFVWGGVGVTFNF